MTAVAAALITSAFAVTAYVAFFFFRLRGPRFRSGARKLLYHALALGAIWLLMLPLFFLAARLLDGKGFFLLAQGSSAARALCFAYGALVLGMFFFLYLAAYYVVDRSVSSRMMIEIERSSKRRLTLDQLKAVYHIDTKYRDELDGAMQGGFVRKVGERYRCTAKGALLAAAARVAKRVLKLGPGG